MTKPATLPRFASSGGALVTEPTSGEKDSGWVVGQKPPAQYLNWLDYWTYKWCQYLDGLTAEPLTWTGAQAWHGGAVGTGVAAGPGLRGVGGSGSGNGVEGVGTGTGIGGVFAGPSVNGSGPSTEGVHASGGANTGAGTGGAGIAAYGGTASTGDGGAGGFFVGGTSPTGQGGPGLVALGMGNRAAGFFEPDQSFNSASAAAAGIEAYGGRNAGAGANGPGLFAQGVAYGSGLPSPGIKSNGAAGASGIEAFAGTGVAHGVVGTSGTGGVSAYGLKGVGASGGSGVRGDGNGAGYGAVFRGGNSSGTGLIALGGTGGKACEMTSGGSVHALELARGDGSFDSVLKMYGTADFNSAPPPAATAPLLNVLTSMSFAKAMGRVVTAATNVNTLTAAQNVSGVVVSSTVCTVTLAQPMASNQYVVLGLSEHGDLKVTYAITDSSHFILLLSDSSGTAANIGSGGYKFSFVVFGDQ